MHELSMCQGIYAIADRARQGRRVEVIHLRIGQLRQVVPTTLVYCWALVAEATDLAGSELAIEHVPVRLHCTSCEEVTVVGECLDLGCASCGAAQLEVVTGEELMVTALDLGESTSHARPKERHG